MDLKEFANQLNNDRMPEQAGYIVDRPQFEDYSEGTARKAVLRAEPLEKDR